MMNVSFGAKTGNDERAWLEKLQVMRERVSPVWVVLEYRERDEGIEMLWWEHGLTSGTDDINARPCNDVDAGIVAVFEKVSGGPVHVVRADL